MSNASQRTETPESRETASPLSDWNLVCRIRQGDVAAFELIMRRHNRRLYRLARSVVKSGPEAEDVVQQTYLLALEKLGSFTGPQGFASWLGRIALNEALGRLRREARVVSLDDYRDDSDEKQDYFSMNPRRPDQLDPEHLTAWSQIRGLLERAVDDLPVEFRTVFMLRIVEGLSMAETADVLSIRPETVKSRLHRARTRLRESLGDRIEDLMPTLHSFDGARCDRIVANVMAAIASGAVAIGTTPEG
jgi:RNA polymerase sigma-70 factor (ECF subfamily)